MSRYRVPGLGRTDPAEPVRFTFDGRRYEGLRGDMVASALLANGVHLMGRSFKYHQPGGPVSAGSEEPNALIGTSRGPGRFEPNTRTTVQELRQGLVAECQNKWPSLKCDIGAVNGRAYMLFSAGFYYKTFIWPRSFRDKVYEPFIRAAAGLGKLPSEPDPDNYASRYLHKDVLVVGRGAAGIAAALTAARSGAKVVLVDDNPEMGGLLLCDPSVQIEGLNAWSWLSGQLSQLRAAGVTLMTRTTAIGYYHQNMVGLADRPKLIVAGASAYPRHIGFAAFRAIADEIGVYLMVDMAYYAGLIAAGEYPNPVPHAHVTTPATHKTLRSPRGGVIQTNDGDLAKKFNSAVFPGNQGGPLMHVIAAKAVAFGEALQPSFKDYAKAVIANARVLSDTLIEGGVGIVSGGTDCHMVLCDLRPPGVTGKAAEFALERAGLTCNKNAIPFDPEKPFMTSGSRLGSSAGTTRGFDEAEFRQIGQMILRVLRALGENPEGHAAFEAFIRAEVKAMCDRFPIYEA
ncbi:serine hydroxymethyltransferase [Pannonibacter indicus]|uniref:serine hydroxymethyltransferase n=1 Tax=Pannonibacter indicus TaxID=466044 RepID=UPI00391AFAD9